MMRDPPDEPAPVVMMAGIVLVAVFFLSIIGAIASFFLRNGGW